MSRAISSRHVPFQNESFAQLTSTSTTPDSGDQPQGDRAPVPAEKAAPVGGGKLRPGVSCSV